MNFEVLSTPGGEKGGLAMPFAFTFGIDLP